MAQRAFLFHALVDGAHCKAEMPGQKHCAPCLYFVERVLEACVGGIQAAQFDRGVGLQAFKAAPKRCVSTNSPRGCISAAAKPEMPEPMMATFMGAPKGWGGKKKVAKRPETKKRGREEKRLGVSVGTRRTERLRNTEKRRACLTPWFRIEWGAFPKVPAPGMQLNVKIVRFHGWLPGTGRASCGNCAACCLQGAPCGPEGYRRGRFRVLARPTLEAVHGQAARWRHQTMAMSRAT
ncbi:MAG: hypothetical protein R3E55_10020 [Burkholderiaceae bacterium]